MQVHYRPTLQAHFKRRRGHARKSLFVQPRVGQAGELAGQLGGGKIPRLPGGRAPPRPRTPLRAARSRQVFTMKTPLRARIGLWVPLLAGAALPQLAGCDGTIVRNLTEQRTGDITMVFINNTPYTAAFSFGTFDGWDRSPPGPMDFQQQVLAPNSSTAPLSVQCARNAAVASEDFVERAIMTDQDDTVDDFNPDALDTTVHFSAAPSDSADADLPDAGTAVGVEKLLGVHYSCGDELIFTFSADPNEPGGFRVDYEVIIDAQRDR
jgi:hypothetical protein